MDMGEKTVDNEERTACEVWTRVMGYYRPVTAFNKGKRSEYEDRKCFKEVCCCDKSSS
ncbi:MAG: anaerobic ribonucleoside-triphosphate reductase [Holosporales bacterium]|jgi:anaerobic ribonucleoside-triphosphate reductase|nr:anaerobic ribonucleoside-triphosphate reductase [Holosporales bacterium]